MGQLNVRRLSFFRVAGQPHGKGKVTLLNGDIYDGEYKDGRPNGEGKGIITSTNDDIYTGEYKDGLRNGKGKYTYTNDDIYDGEWKDDLFHGKGKGISLRQTATCTTESGKIVSGTARAS